MNAASGAIEDVVAVVLEYHRPEATLRCLKSLAKAGITSILVWDNSTDAGKTRAELDHALAKDDLLASRTTIAGNNVNLGFSAGVNAAIAHVSATRKPRFFLLINNDATINPEGVSGLLQALRSDPKNAMAAPEYLNSETKSRALMYYHPLLAALTEKEYLGSFAFLSGCCLLVDIEKTGLPLLDEAFFMYGEDVALSRKLRVRGYSLAIAESASVEHVGAASSVVGSAFYEYHVARGHILLTSRIANSRAHAWLLWPTRLASLLTRSLLRSLRARSFTPVKALWRAVFSMGAI